MPPKTPKGKRIDPSDSLHNNKKLGLYFFHVPTGKEVDFKAFLTTYEDKFESKWSSERVYGRMDPIHTFQGTERSISLAWDVPSFSEAEGELNFSKAALLYSMLYPTYSAGRIGTISSSPLIKLKFGNLIIDASKVLPTSAGSLGAMTAKASGLLGYIDGLTFSPDLESGFFDSEPGKLIPQTIKLTCNFHILHTHKLGWTRGKELRKSSKNYPYNVSHYDGSASTKGETVAPATGEVAALTTAAQKAKKLAESKVFGPPWDGK